MHRPGLTERDLDFVVEAAAPEAQNKNRLRRLLQEDPQFRRALVSDDRVFDRVMADDGAFARISPALFFDILLRRTAREMKASGHTVERTGAQRVAVFDAGQVSELLSREGILEYLADMLSSFTRVRTYVTRVRARRGVWRRIRSSDMDVDGLARLCAEVDEEQRFPLYKRMGDACLFILGVFPEHASSDYRYASSGLRRPTVGGRTRRGPEDYVSDGVRAYGLASGHEAARAAGLSGVLSLLRADFRVAVKPLAFMSEHHLRFSR